MFAAENNDIPRRVFTVSGKEPIALQPLTFKEIFDAFGGDKRDLLEDYLRYGGLPLCVLTEGDQNKENYLCAAYETIYEKDILDGKRIKNTAEFRELAGLVFYSTDQ